MRTGTRPERDKGPEGDRAVSALFWSLLLAGLACTWGLVVPVATAAPLTGATIESVTVSPGSLPPGGGVATVSARVSHATTCQLTLLSRQRLPVVYSHAARGCSDGNFAAHIIVGANPGQVERAVVFSFRVTNRRSSAVRHFSVDLAAPAHVVVLSVDANPQVLGPHGGQVTVTGQLRHATKCRLVLVSTQSFNIVYASNKRSCSSTLVARVIIGPNPTPVARTVTFELVAYNSTSTRSRRFRVFLAAPPLATTTVPTSTTTVPTPTTTVPAATTTVPPSTTTTGAPGTEQERSTNWSGYAASGQTYTYASATFTVPYLTTAASCAQALSEWVGVDGFGDTPGTKYLIQAGIGASMTNPGTDQCAQGNFYVWPWWEVLPANETDITTWDDGTTAAVSAGDKVTVTISQDTSTTWSIELTDDTSDESYTTEQYYDGPGASAEWVVEATTDKSLCGGGVNGEGVCPMPAYADASGGQPGVIFSDLGLAPKSNSTWHQITAQQNGVAVSTPSALSTNGSSVTGFTVSYTRGAGPDVAQPGRAAAMPVLGELLPAGRLASALTTVFGNVTSSHGDREVLAKTCPKLVVRAVEHMSVQEMTTPTSVLARPPTACSPRSLRRSISRLVGSGS